MRRVMKRVPGLVYLLGIIGGLIMFAGWVLFSLVTFGLGFGVLLISIKYLEV